VRASRLIIAACLMSLASAASARVPVTVPPPPPFPLTEQQRSAREQACRSDVQRIFGSGADRPAYLDAAMRRADSELRLRGIGEILGSAVLELRVYVVAMVQLNLSEHSIGSQPAYFQCQFDHEGNVVEVEIV
jgi:hypothetical protein